MFLSNIVAFDFVYRLAAYAEVLIWQFLDGDGEELFRDMGYLGGCCCQPFYQLFLLFRGELSAFNRYVWHISRLNVEFPSVSLMEFQC